MVFPFWPSVIWLLFLFLILYHPLVHSPTGLTKARSWVSWKPGVTSCGYRAPSTCIILHYVPRHIIRELAQKWSIWDLNQYSYGMLLSHMELYCYATAPAPLSIFHLLVYTLNTHNIQGFTMLNPGAWNFI